MKSPNYENRIPMSLVDHWELVHPLSILLVSLLSRQIYMHITAAAAAAAAAAITRSQRILYVVLLLRR